MSRLDILDTTKSCFLCKEVLPVEAFGTLDHIVPLPKGGSDFIGNLLPACRACNSKKHDKLLIEWRAEVYRLAP